MRRYIYLLFVLVVVSFRSVAQHENTLYSIYNVPQATYLNPAIMPNYKVSLGLPGISSTYFTFVNTGFSYNDIVKKEGDNGNYINLNDFYAGLKGKNYTKIMLNSDLFSLGFRAGSRMHVTFNVTEKVNARLMIPKGLFWAIEGNAPEVAGNTIQMGPQFDATHYREFGIGTSYVVNKKLTLGGRVKLLYGKGSIYTEKSDFALSTSSEAYQLSLKTSALIHTSGIDQLTEDNSEFDFQNYALNKNNKGLAFDLGASYKVFDRLTISASILDLGSIRWKDNVKNYALNEASYSFNGFSLTGDDEFKNIEDSVETNFKFNETTSSYKTTLPTKLYLGGNYLLFRNFYAGVLFFGEYYKKGFSPSISASLTKNFGRMLSLSLSYTSANRSANQIGSGFVIKLKPMQLYVVSDNIIGAAVMPKSTKDISARFGINFVFGKIPTEDKQTYK